MLAGESIEEWLKINRKRSFLLGLLRLGGVHHGGWWPPTFCADNEPDEGACTLIRRISRQRDDSRAVFLDAADRMAIGDKIVLSGKSILSRKSQGFP